MRLRATLFSCLSFVLLAGIAIGQDSQSSSYEYKVKAAFLFNFAKFVEWPSNAFASADSPMVIGILGNNPFGDTLKNEIQDRTINERRVEIKEMRSLTEVTNCQVLFISP